MADTIRTSRTCRVEPTLASYSVMPLKRRLAWQWVLLAGGVVLVGMVTALVLSRFAPTAPDSGIRGTVLLTSGLPGFKNSSCSAGHACPAQAPPLQMSATKLHILTLPGRQEVASVWSDQNGSFQVNVPPGRYSVSPGQNHWWPWGRELPSGAQTGTPVEVSVVPHAFVQVTVFLSDGLA